MIGKVFVVVAVAFSCAVAQPFGNCGPWDAPGLSNLLAGPGLPGPIPAALNFPAPPAVVDAAPASSCQFPANIFAPAGPAPGLPVHVPAPALPPLHVPRIPGQGVHHIVQHQVPNFPPQILPGPVFDGRIEVPRVPAIETRIPALPTRVPAFQPRIAPIDAAVHAFSAAQPQVIQNIPGLGAPFGQPC